MKDRFRLDLSGIPKELKLMIAILREQSVERVHNLAPDLLSDINWPEFINQVKHHRTYPLIYPRVKNQATFIPANVIDTLGYLYKANTFQMLHLSREMDEVHKMFQDNQIRTIFLKGPFLASIFYGDISQRTSNDLDMLVPIDQLGNVEKLLLSRGYLKDDYISTVLEDWKWRHHHITFYHPEKQTKLEVHWRLNPGPAKEPSFEELWQRKAEVSLTGTPLCTLGKEDLFLILTSHGARHGWSRLRWLMDIHALIKQDLDWKQINKLASKYQIKRPGGQALWLLEGLLDVEDAKEVALLKHRRSRQHLAQRAVFYLEQKVNLHTDPVPGEVSRYHSRYLFSLMGLQQRALFLLSFLYPYPEDARTLPLPKSLHMLYFPLRPFLWSWRKARKQIISQEG